MLELLVRQVMDDYQKRSGKKSRNVEVLSVNAPHAWDFNITFNVAGLGHFTIRQISDHDLPLLKEFKRQLSQPSRNLVPCYPWDDKKKLEAALRQAIKKTLERIDASYVIERESKPVAHFFLWKAGGNEHSLKYGTDIPELGVAVADAFQGFGFGSLCVRLLQAVAQSLKRDAVELTTAQSNEAGWHTYLKTGFKYTGDINNPLEVDVTEVFAGAASPNRCRVERQMVYIINQDKTQEILNYLSIKRQEAKKFI